MLFDLLMKEIPAPWDESLTATTGDYLVSEIDAPNDRWSVSPEIFEESYEVVRPRVCVKRAITNLAPLVDLTDGDENQLVTVYTLEGPETVRAGDFYLARGIKGEIWTCPKQMIEYVMKPTDQ